ncbi:lipopolysaccharide biosynthesis protein [Chelatococcus asaccharovorans]|uniref:lipopolysaccharide biosynthesis protein n=1 Tax=Chelatococcus asaccharovorans TaxID=28210 RepID=UPI00224C7016|nr:polysaccharide biosynthesis C-terminal domain-containing protein [Chelatococcus asaccharovorans]CAH1669002.1 O-antigen/teichoic acid export membrane protein [Chelatococcus asaccharovorans]CAH1679550.1 O-antigen/teichoic acid export membrane protein [Chelatococcus asaccharovorans]
MTIILTFAVNSILNFLLGLLVAKFLGPAEFGRYAIAAAIATVVNTVCLDWLRLSATRFYSERTRREEPAVRATLEATFGIMALAVCFGAGLVILSGVDTGFSPGLIAATAAMCIAIGIFDFHTALARARFLERGYAHLVIVKNVALFILMVGSAMLFENAAVVAFGFAAGSLIAIVVGRIALADPGLTLGAARPALARTFLAYGLPLVGANAIFQLMTILNRGAVASHYGFAEAGYFSLAADLGIRIFAVAGSAVDILLFQLAVRTDETHGREAASQQVSRNLVVILAFLAPLAAGYFVLLPPFQAVFVPSDFRGPFATYSFVLIPALLSFSLLQFALNPVFQIRKRTTPVIVAAGFGLAVNLGLMTILPATFGPVGFALAQMGGMLAALALTFMLALPLMAGRPPLKDLLVILGATALTAAAVWPLRAFDSALLALILGPVLGGAIYAALVLGLDVAGLRGAVLQRLKGQRS